MVCQGSNAENTAYSVNFVSFKDKILSGKLSHFVCMIILHSHYQCVLLLVCVNGNIIIIVTASSFITI